MRLNIGIDGPVGAGKSTVADAVAAKLGILHLDTGAMYRALGLTALRQNIDVQDEQAIVDLCGKLKISVSHEADGQHTFVEGEDVTGLIRTQEVGMAASTVSRYAEVRKAMVRLQQKLASETDMLLDGRDICTTVLPNATAKIYLTASAEERARRRFLELQKKGSEESFEQVLQEVIKRDEQDMNRPVEPLPPTSALMKWWMPFSRSWRKSAVAEKKLEPVTEKRGILYEIARVLAQILFHTLMPVRFHHKERLRQDPPFVLIANHRHALDPVVMAMGIPKHQIVFLAKKELAGKSKFLRNLLTRLHCILVGRHDTDMEAMRACMKTVKMKKVLLIFPEGTRHHEEQMEHIESGTSLIAMRSKAPVIPIYFDRKLSLFKVTNLYVGEPIPYDDLLAEGINTETCEQMNERIRETFRGMIKDAEKK